MEEGNKGEPREPAPSTAAPRDGGLTQELARVRGRNKVLKIVTIILSAFFLAILLAAAYIYHRISALSSMFANLDTGSSTALNTPYVPSPQQGAFPGVSGSTGMPVSSLMMLSGLSDTSTSSVQGGGQALPSFQPQKALGLIAKYGNRPIVRDFMAELSKDPDFKKALDRNGDPMAITRIFQNRAEMQKLMMKFAMRPDFMPFMNEVMADPDVMSLLAATPGGSQAMQAAQMYKGGAIQPIGSQTQQEPRMTVQDLRSSTSTGGARIDPSDLSAPAPIKTKTPPPISE